MGISRAGWAVLALVATAVLAGFTIAGVAAYAHGLPEGGDTAVYRAGAQTLLRGLPLYDSDVLPATPEYARLPFTYAPFAAVVFVPLVLVPVQIGWGVLDGLSAVAVMAVACLVLRRAPRRPRWLAPVPTGVVFGLAALLAAPVAVTLGYGQVNAILMVMIVADVLVLCRARGSARRAGGVLIGVAAAIKLTPLAFVVHLLIIGRKADAARAAGTFAGLQGLMLIVAPHDTARFWTHTVFDADRIGPVTSSWNQSVSSVVRRLSDSASWAQALTLGLCAVLAVGALVLVRRYQRQGRPVHALLVTAYLTLLVSPVSWIHHWVWVVPLAALLLAEACAGNRAARLLLPVTVLVFAVRPAHAMNPGHAGESPLSPWTLALNNTYLLYALVLGAVLLERTKSGIRSTQRNECGGGCAERNQRHIGARQTTASGSAVGCTGACSSEAPVR
jgi:alpha-1,2-mannosyltransferase